MDLLKKLGIILLFTYVSIALNTNVSIEDFKSFVVKYNKRYSTQEEFFQRFEVYKDNVKKIAEWQRLVRIMFCDEACFSTILQSLSKEQIKLIAYAIRQKYMAQKDVQESLNMQILLKKNSDLICSSLQR